MIFKMLSNMNSVFNHIFMFFILLVVIYLIYKIFLLETEVFLLNEKMNKIELDLNNNDTTINTCKITNTTNTVNLTEEDMKVSEYIMNEIFNEDDKNIVELDIEKEEVFDLKKEVLKKNPEKEPQKELLKEPLKELQKELQKEPEREHPDETESISSNVNVMNKKKLQKLNLDKLKEKCMELGLSVEGTKAQLIDRILEI